MSAEQSQRLNNELSDVATQWRSETAPPPLQARLVAEFRGNVSVSRLARPAMSLALAATVMSTIAVTVLMLPNNTTESGGVPQLPSISTQTLRGPSTAKIRAPRAPGSLRLPVAPQTPKPGSGTAPRPDDKDNLENEDVV